MDEPSDARAAREVVVAYQGAEGAYSHAAAGRHFAGRGLRLTLRGYDGFEAMLVAVASGDADRAMLPVENTTAGSIVEAYDLLARMDLAVVGEEVHRVRHCLVALRPVAPGDIRRVISHPQALAQCTRFLASLRGCKAESYTDTAMAVAKVREDADPAQAAIASEDAAALHGLTVVARDIADQRENFTRFVVVAREPVAVDERVPCKTMMLFATRHEHGALARCLVVLADHGLNLTKIESRPRPGTPFEYLFHVDFEGNVASETTRAALEAVRAHTSFMKVLGSFPARTMRGADGD